MAYSSLLFCAVKGKLSIGVAVLDDAVIYLSLPDCQAIELDYDRDNLTAARLYSGCGFQPIEETDDGEI